MNTETITKLQDLNPTAILNIPQTYGEITDESRFQLVLTEDHATVVFNWGDINNIEDVDCVYWVEIVEEDVGEDGFLNPPLSKDDSSDWDKAWSIDYELNGKKETILLVEKDHDVFMYHGQDDLFSLFGNTEHMSQREYLEEFM